jgi:hypothetical protein
MSLETDNWPFRLVHFFGPDGSGKSTQADILVKVLRKCGVRAEKFWIRSPHTLAFLLWRLLVKIGFYRAVSNPFGVSIKLPAVDRSRSLRLFWSLTEFFSVLPLIMRCRFLMWRGYVLVAERHILDTVTTIAYFLDDLEFLSSKISRLLFCFIPKDTVFIFLDSDYETIFHRRAPLFDASVSKPKRRVYGSIPKLAVEPKEFINFQRSAYRALAKSFNALEIDASTCSIKETSNIILKYLRLS